MSRTVAQSCSLIIRKIRLICNKDGVIYKFKQKMTLPSYFPFRHRLKVLEQMSSSRDYKGPNPELRETYPVITRSQSRDYERHILELREADPGLGIGENGGIAIHY